MSGAEAIGARRVHRRGGSRAAACEVRRRSRSSPSPDGWEDEWKRFHRPVEVGSLWIGPPWEEPTPGSSPVVIDPGRAFGTGAHPTTRLCLELIQSLERASLLDVGSRLGRARDRGVQARLRARRGDRRRRGGGRGDEAERGGERRPRRSARCSTPRPTRCPTPRSSSRTSTCRRFRSWRSPARCRRRS